jgi:uncharacterized protein YkwD
MKTIVIAIALIVTLSIVYYPQTTVEHIQPVVEKPFISQYSDFYKEINDYRELLGLNKLKPNEKLEKSAKLKAKHMIETDCWDHICGLKTFQEPVLDVGYDYIYIGENLAEGFAINESPLADWIASPTHNENLMFPNYLEQGVYIQCGLNQERLNACLYVHHLGRAVN